MKTKCEYCPFTDCVGKSWNDKWLGAKTYILANREIQEYYLVTADGKMSAPIKYCPMCGRKLSEDSSGKFLRMFKTGLPNGFPDLFGFKHSNNKIFFIEMKDAKGRPREDQIRFHKHLVELNAIHGIARSPQDALKIIDEELVGYGFDD